MSAKPTRMLNPKFKERIAELVASEDISISKFSKSIGYDRKAIYSWMNGESTPSASGITKICKTYKVSADWLLGLKDSRENLQLEYTMTFSQAVHEMIMNGKKVKGENFTQDIFLYFGKANKCATDTIIAEIRGQKYPLRITQETYDQKYKTI